MSNERDIVMATTRRYRLAEGPMWDPIRQRVLFVDILDGGVHSGELLEDGMIAVKQSLSFPHVAGAVAVSADGELLVAGLHSCVMRDRRGIERTGATLLPADSSRRLNDGKPDPAGRFVVGTLDMAGGSATETLVRIEADGSITTLDDDLTLSNGLAWSTDGSRMYSVDTNTQKIFVRPYDATSGAVGDRELFVRIAGGYPDGICIDADDHVWVAVWGGGEVRRYVPDGTLADRIEIGVPHVSAVAFAGPELDRLVVTTAYEGLSSEQREAHPLSGAVFTLTPGVRGAPQVLWSGSAGRPNRTPERNL